MNKVMKDKILLVKQAKELESTKGEIEVANLAIVELFEFGLAQGVSEASTFSRSKTSPAIIRVYANLVESGAKELSDIPESVRPLVEAELESRK